MYSNLNRSLKFLTKILKQDKVLLNQMLNGMRLNYVFEELAERPNRTT